MPTESQLYRVNVVRYDDVLRFQVPSRRRGHPPYLVQLDGYGGNGTCVCKHFGTRLEPLLKQGISPQSAVRGGLAAIPPWGTTEDALRCFHIHAARLKFADDVVERVMEERKTLPRSAH